MIKKRKSELRFATLLFLLLIFPTNLSFGQGLPGMQSQYGRYNNYGGGMGLGATSPYLGPLTFRYPIENLISSQFPDQFRVYSPYGAVPRNGVVSRKSSIKKSGKNK